jgi:hypothetical protein
MEVVTMVPKQASRKTFGMLFIAMFTACAFYLLVGYMAMGHATHPQVAGPELEILKMCLAVVAAVSIIAGLQLPRFTLTDDKLREKGSKQGAMNLIQTYAVIALAILESVAIYGLLWTFVSFELKHLPYTTGLAMLAMLYLRTLILGYFDKAEQLFPMDK